MNLLLFFLNEEANWLARILKMELDTVHYIILKLILIHISHMRKFTC